MVRKNKIINFYNDFVTHLIKDRIYGNRRHAEIYKFINSIFKIKKINNVLEIGCGIGIISEYLSRKTNKVFGIDISKNSIKFASSTVKNVNFTCMDFLGSNIKHKFDLITLFDVLEHFPKASHPKVFKKIVKCSNENTLIAITIPDPNYLDYFRQNFPDRLQLIDESIHFDEFFSLIKKFNLEIMEYKRFGIYYENQYRFYLLSYHPKTFLLKKKNNIDKRKTLLYRILNRAKVEIRKIKYKKALGRLDEK